MAEITSHAPKEEPGKPGDVSTGTTIMACEYAGGVVLGADSRTSTGAYIANRVADKIQPISDTIYSCRSGSAADTQAVGDYASRYLSDYAMQKGRAANVATAAHMVGGIMYNNKDNLSAGMIVAGIDSKLGGQVYTVTLGGTVVRQPLAIGGSGSTFIYGLCDHEFRVGMSKEEAVVFVRKMISHAMARDGSSGGVIRTVVISSSGVERGYQSGEWDRLPFSLEAGTKTIAEDSAEASGDDAGASSSSSSSSAAAV